MFLFAEMILFAEAIVFAEVIILEVGNTATCILLSYLAANVVLRYLNMKSLEKRDWWQWNFEHNTEISEHHIHDSNIMAEIKPTEKKSSEQPNPQYPG